jgi:diguanylate cyclase (GGDEF)-like protein
LAKGLIKARSIKLISVKYGHIVGDQVLTLIAQRVQKCLRKVDLAGRYGGKEFIILLPGSSLESAQAIAERCRRAIAETPVTAGEFECNGAISLGLVCLTQGDGMDLQALINCADQLLFSAKQTGRNRITFYGAP